MKIPRIGYGYDVHRFVDDRKLIIGGIEIPHDRGLLGHSDADVLLHAISDAILGALALGDIGKHFPDTDPKYKGADSAVLLAEVYVMMSDKGYQIGNIDATVVCEKPKLSPYILAIRTRIAEILHTDVEQISVKATTEEGLGLANQGVGAHAICVLI